MATANLPLTPHNPWPGWTLARLGLVRVRSRTALGATVGQHSVVACCFAASLFLGNVAYLGLSVAFIAILKSLTPLATLVAGLAMGLEKMSLSVGLATALIALGTMIATAQVCVCWNGAQRVGGRKCMVGGCHSFWGESCGAREEGEAESTCTPRLSNVAAQGTLPHLNAAQGI